MGRMPSRSTPRHLPSSHLSHPHPLSPSSSSLTSIAISLGPSPQERVSISLPRPKSEFQSPSLSLLRCQPPRLICEEGSLFFSPPPRHSGISVPPPRLKLSFKSRSTPAQLHRQIRYVQYFIFLMTSDVDTLSGPQRSRPRHAGHSHVVKGVMCLMHMHTQDASARTHMQDARIALCVFEGSTFNTHPRVQGSNAHARICGFNPRTRSRVQHTSGVVTL